MHHLPGTYSKRIDYKRGVSTCSEKGSPTESRIWVSVQRRCLNANL